MVYLQGNDRYQSRISTHCLDETIAADNPVRVIDAFVDSLPLKDFGFRMDYGENGRPAYHPADLLKLYIYGYQNRIRTSRTLEAECKRNIELFWLLKELRPDHNTINRFRKDNTDAIRQVFRATVKTAQNLNLIGGTLLAGDSTKLRAQNSKKNNYNREKIKRHMEYIDRKLDEYNQHMPQADVEDEHDDTSQDVDRDQINKDHYTCPMGRVLRSNGNWYQNQSKTGRFKQYKTTACKRCILNTACTKSRNGRILQRNEFSHLTEKNKARILENPILYKQRQAIVEHPFGTMKRQWGFDHVLTKKFIQHAAADVGLVFVAYNLKRLMALASPEALKAAFGVLFTLFLARFWPGKAPNGHTYAIFNKLKTLPDFCAYLFSRQQRPMLHPVRGGL